MNNTNLIVNQSLPTLPNEILNLIFSFRSPHPVALILSPIFKNWKFLCDKKHLRKYFHKLYFDGEKFIKKNHPLTERKIKLILKILN
jgi:hypothetical protein